jgi:hypothetical protein
MLASVNMNGPHIWALVLSWAVFVLLGLMGFLTPGKRIVLRLVERVNPGRAFLVAVVMMLGRCRSGL